MSGGLVLWGASFSGIPAVHRTPGAPFLQSTAGLVSTFTFFLQSAVTLTALFWLPEGRFVVAWGAAATGTIVIILGSLYSLVSFPLAHDLVNIAGIAATFAGVWAATVTSQSNPLRVTIAAKKFSGPKGAADRATP